MSWMGTDMMALACIVGSGALGGTATLAALRGDAHVDHDCRVEAVDVSPGVVVVTDAGARSVVVSRDVQVHSSHGCAEGVHVEVDASEFQFQAHGVHLEALKELEHLQHMENLAIDFEGLNVDLEGLNIDLEGLDIQLEAMGVELDQEIQRRIGEEMAQLEIQQKKKGNR